jgi:hypothetical protein
MGPPVGRHENLSRDQRERHAKRYTWHEVLYFRLFDISAACSSVVPPGT